ncbi:putative Tautomerase/MIF superfamily, tautomerase, cis-CaaD [Septoria linicola]|nr:putative Tautomerase/MIF superfamily, tautomerase, cis-CaaD [Septoria linicola]
MPLYEIRHITPLTPSQQDSLADALTTIHSTKFTTPRMFVNVVFTEYSKVNTYVGGKRKQGNHIMANVRVGPSRTQKDWDELGEQVAKAWGEIVPEGELRTFFVLGGLTAGFEAGFSIPPAGGDVEWLEKNFAAFEKKAKAGDEEFADLVAEIEERGLMKQQTNGH